MWCDAVSEVEPSGAEPSGAELTRYGPARKAASEMQPPRPPRGGHPSDGGEFSHPDRLAAAPPTQFLRRAMSAVQTVTKETE